MRYRPLFPYFGGKSKIAGEVWKRFGDTPNYIEPFFGSGAVLFLRPSIANAKFETVNDADCLLANFWRAAKAAPEAVADHMMWPVNEADLHSRHRWLADQREAMRSRIDEDPEFFDAKIAGWWAWGASMWLGSRWGWSETRSMPAISSASGPIASTINVLETLKEMSKRLERVRVLSGDWTRIVSPSVADHLGITSIFFDPPYDDTFGMSKGIYGCDGGSLGVSGEVRSWAVSRGENPLLRIALCGYFEEHDERVPETWERVRWSANGGYGNRGGRGSQNRHRECIWFSPHCLKPEDDLFGFR